MHLDSWGAEGSAEVLAFQQPDLVYEPEMVLADPFDVDVFFSRALDESLVASIRSVFPECSVEVSAEENRDWMAEWKKGFRPFRFAGPYWVVPSWLEAPADAERILSIDPGMAFGTGTHETTALAAELIIGAFEHRRGRGLMFTSVADIGSGTGILALVAKGEGAGKVVANDIDPEARRTARENLSTNQAQDIEVTDLRLDQLPESAYDMVIANIIDGVLVSLAPDLERVARPDGEIILSGILREREASFLGQFATRLRTPAEWQQTARVERGEWVALHFSRRRSEK